MLAKIVYNACRGAFGLSNKAKDRYAEIAGREPPGASEMSRTDPVLVQVIEELGDAADGPKADLRILDLPPGGYYRIQEDNGQETVERPEDEVWEDT